VIDIVCASSFCKTIVVTRSEAVHALCRRRQMPCLLHQMPHRRDTIRIGLDSLLREMNGDLDGCVFFQGDQPLVTPESIKAMILAFQQDHRSIYRLAYQGKPGSPVLFPRACFDELMHLPSHSGGSLVIRNHPELTRTVEARSPYELLDVDTPDALQYLRKLSI
jgi:molybdenum cofactor cytidylyltransferase